ncbi:PD-(D/E)XK nuclease family protein [Zunongwangia sp. H14]|uniref:PDDEXK-like family protein n=1 Tax=Zunongwangia sp. H14 TaxID=3240792 RepID=UPI0035664315
MEETKSHCKLIQEASRILEHQKEISTLKGENFNIFSILKMETKENATHSAFLGELLNPEGSHDLGSTFLKLFLDTLQVKSMDIDSARVKLEYYVGERNDGEKTGGRVDIFIYDKDLNSICVENKIYAPDQNVQIQRYCNYNRNNNLVFYLTLEGEEPGKGSKGKLKSGEHFHLLSYSTDIVNWLRACAKEAVHFPIIRETIQQYIILIKKLTNQLTDHKMQNEIQKLIAENYNTTRTLVSNLKVVELKYTNLLLNEIKGQLEKELKEGWTVEAYNDLEEAWTGLYINHEEWPKKVYVKLEGQSKVPWSDSIYGIIGNKNNCDRDKLNKELAGVELLQEGFRSNNVWPFYKTILHFSNDESRAILFDEQKRKELALDLSEKFLELAKACEEPLKKVQNTDQVKETPASLN